MAKQAKKLTREEKVAMKAAEEKQMKKAEPKVKGPQPPSYSKNTKREIARILQESAHAANLAEHAKIEKAARVQADLTAMQNRYAMLLDGVIGKYEVGYMNVFGDLVTECYEVDVWHLPEKDGLPAREIIGIFGYCEVFVPLAWLFRPKEEINLLQNWRGDVQAAMLDFLREHLAHDIAHAKAERARKIAEARAPRLATLDGKNVEVKAVKPSHDTKKVLSTKVFGINIIGRFDFSDGAHHCTVVQEPVDGKMTLMVISITDGHKLACDGVRPGLFIRSIDLKDGVAEAARSLGDEFFAHAKLLREFVLEKLNGMSIKKEPAKQNSVAA